MYSNSHLQLERSQLITVFNKHFFDFIDDILSIYPDCATLRGARNSFETFKSLNPTSIVKVWHAFIYMPYRAEILEGNVDFFVNKDYHEDIAGKTKNIDKIMARIEDVRECVATMSAQNKAHTAKYILNLSRLSEAYAIQ